MKFGDKPLGVSRTCQRIHEVYGKIKDYRAKRFHGNIMTPLSAISVLTPSKDTRNSVFILRLCSCSPSFLSQSKESTSSDKSKINKHYKTPT